MNPTTSRTIGQPRLIVAAVLAAWSSSPSGWAAELNVPAQYPTIQEAVEAAADGDTIHIAPGVYAERILLLRKKLTLLGRPGAVIRAFPGMNTTLRRDDLPGGGLESTPALLAAAVSDVVLQGLVFEGEHLGEAYGLFGYMAIVFDASSGRLEDCTVRGSRSADTLDPFAWGVVAANWATLGTPPLTVEVLRCTFADNGTSVHVRGDDRAPAEPRLNFTIAENTITGIGPTALGVQTGIEIGAGAVGEVRRNLITDHFFTTTEDMSDFLGSMGIIALDVWYLFGGAASPRTLLPVRYEDNTFRANQHQLVFLKARDSQAVNNTFQGLAGDGRFASGITVSGENMLIASNRFSDLAVGIKMIGNEPLTLWDPQFRTTFGSATNPRLLGNRFCNVLVPRAELSDASGVTEEGTLVCPFPDPTLEIAPAAILSWPAYTEGWNLETAPTVNGPWTATTTLPTVEGDQNTVAVKTGSEHQFFRLHKP